MSSCTWFYCLALTFLSLADATGPSTSSGSDLSFWKDKNAQLKSAKIHVESERDRYRSLVLSQEQELGRFRTALQEARSVTQEKDRTISLLKEVVSSQCKKIASECQSVVMDHLSSANIPMDNTLYDKLEFEAVARSTNYFAEMERFGRRPGTTQFTIGGLGASPSELGLAPIPEDQEASSGSALQPKRDIQGEKSAEAPEGDK